MDNPLRAELARVTIALTSPDKTVRLRTGLDGRVELAFAPGSFADHTKDTVAHQLAGLLRSGVTARQMAFDQAVDRAFADPDAIRKYAPR